MRPITTGGRRVKCPICKRKYATAHVLGTLTCGKCLRALFVGFMAGQNYAWDEVHKKYDIKRKEVRE